MCIGLLSVQWPWGGSLPRTVFLIVSDPCGPEMKSSLATSARCLRWRLCVPTIFGRAAGTVWWWGTQTSGSGRAEGRGMPTSTSLVEGNAKMALPSASILGESPNRPLSFQHTLKD